MLNWVLCYLSGRHDYTVWCEPGSVYLRCVHCGRRSPGWSLEPTCQHVPSRVVKARSVPRKFAERVLPFERRIAAR